MTTMFNVRPGLIATFVVSALVAFTSLRCDAKAKQPSASLDGYIAVVRGYIPASDLQGGDLLLISLADSTVTVLGASISGNDAPTYSAATNSIIAVKQSGNSPLTGPLPEVTSYGIKVAGQQAVAEGRRPSARNDKLAFCDLNGKLVVLDLPTGAASVVDGFQGGSGCTRFAWSHDGRLAFIAPSASGVRPPASLALYIREADGRSRSISLPDAIGTSTVSWSPDDKYIAVGIGGVGIVVKESSTGDTAFTLPGDDARYADDGGRLAVLTFGRADSVLSTYDGSKLLGTRRLGSINRPAFAWIAGTNALAVNLDHSIGIWGPKDNTFSKIAVDGVLLSDLQFVPGS